MTPFRAICEDYETESENSTGCDPITTIDCKTQRGYVGWVLMDEDIRWLDNVRILVVEDMGGVFVTGIFHATQNHALALGSVDPKTQRWQHTRDK
ncbi:hypothetical protein BDW71DRAFT_206089 [Aspergillus fruticulosus]